MALFAKLKNLEEISLEWFKYLDPPMPKVIDILKYKSQSTEEKCSFVEVFVECCEKFLKSDIKLISFQNFQTLYHKSVHPDKFKVSRKRTKTFEILVDR